MTTYYGNYIHALDSQCRVSLPSDWRVKDGDTELILAPTSDNALILLPPEQLDAFFEKMKTASITNAKIQRALAGFGSLCKKCKCDRQGRIALDRSMLDGIGVGNQVQLSGAVTQIRISAPAETSGINVSDALAALDEINSLLSGSVDNAIKNILGDK